MDRKQLATLLAPLRYVAIDGPRASPSGGWTATVRRIGDPSETPMRVRVLQFDDPAAADRTAARLQAHHQRTSSYAGQGLVATATVLRPDTQTVLLVRPWYPSTLDSERPLNLAQLEAMVRFVDRATEWLRAQGLQHGNLVAANVARPAFQQDAWLLVDAGVEPVDTDRVQARRLLVDLAGECVRQWPDDPKAEILRDRLERTEVAWDALLGPKLRPAPMQPPRRRPRLPVMRVGAPEVVTTLTRAGVGLAWSHDATQLAVGWSAGVNWVDGEGRLRRLLGDGYGLFFSPDDRYLAGHGYSSITVWDLTNNGQAHHHTFEVAVQGLYPTAEGLLAAQLDGRVEAFEWQALEPRPDVAELTRQPDADTRGGEFAWDSEPAVLKLKHASTGTPVAGWWGAWQRGDVHPSLSLVLLRETGSQTRRARLALSDLRGTIIWAEEVCFDVVPRAAFSPDGRSLVCTTSGDAYTTQYPVYRWPLQVDTPATHILRRTRKMTSG